MTTGTRYPQEVREGKLATTEGQLATAQNDLATANRAFHIAVGCASPVMHEWYHGTLSSLARVIHGRYCHKVRSATRP